MKLRVIGSGGALPFPKPGCGCEDCEKAKKKGIPYERISSSLFVYPNILIDTPEEVFRRLIKFDIKNLSHVFFTHWHPDHTQGHRLFEFWVKSGFVGRKNKKPINVYLPKDMIPDFESYFKKDLDFYKRKKYIKIVEVEDRKPIGFGNIKITPVNFKRDDRVRYGFLIEEHGKRVMYAPCSVFNAKFDEFWKNLDVLFIETGWRGNTKEYRKKKVVSWFEDHISLEEDFGLLEKLRPKKMILTHLIGSTHQTYDDIKKRAEKYPNVDVAFDGMVLDL